MRAPSVVEIATTSGIGKPERMGTGDHQHRHDALDRRTPVPHPPSSQPTSVTAAATMATIVRQNAARSASACARERDVCASATSRMMPASAVFSPVPVTSTRSEPEPFTVPGDHRAPGAFRTGSRLTGDHRFVDVARPVAHDPVGGHARAGPDEHEVACLAGRETGPPPVASPAIRTAVSGSSLASSFSAPWACEIDRISIQ